MVNETYMYLCNLFPFAMLICPLMPMRNSISLTLQYILGCDPPPLEMGLARLVEPVYEAGIPKMKGGGAYLGEDRYYKCKHGYVETGIIKLVCIAEQWTTRWTTTEHSCTGNQTIFVIIILTGSCYQNGLRTTLWLKEVRWL